MTVKEITKIDDEEKTYHIEEEGYTYFKILSSHYLRKHMFRMSKDDFHVYFSEEAKDGSTFQHIYRSRDWIFPQKVQWWNENINAVETSIDVTDVAHTEIFMDLLEKYCKKFNEPNTKFRSDFYFFNDLLTDYKVNYEGKIIGDYSRRKRK